jgi:hypothetical protein
VVAISLKLEQALPWQRSILKPVGSLALLVQDRLILVEPPIVAVRLLGAPARCLVSVVAEATFE